jgi:acyl carrier protein
MTDIEIFEGLKEVLAVMKPHLDTSKATLESNLVRDLGIDSLSMLLMSLALENKFNVTFDTTRAPFVTVGEVVNYILENQKQ